MIIGLLIFILFWHFCCFCNLHIINAWIIIIIMCMKATLDPQFVHKILTVGPLFRLVLTFTEDQMF